MNRDLAALMLCRGCNLVDMSVNATSRAEWWHDVLCNNCYHKPEYRRNI